MICMLAFGLVEPSDGFQTRVVGTRYDLGVSLGIDVWRRFLMRKAIRENSPL
jgi:hypothetical protein